MIRLLVLLAALSIGPKAQAQDALRIDLDVTLLPPPGFSFFGYGPEATIPSDGSFLILFREIKPSAGHGGSAIEQLELVGVRPDGHERFRTVLPYREELAGAGFAHGVAKAFEMPSKDIVVFVNGSGTHGICARIIHLTSEGTVTSTVEVGVPPSSPAPDVCFATYSVRPTSDNALWLTGVLTGHDQPSQPGAWFAKLGTDGTFLWDARRDEPGSGGGEAKLRPDGSRIELLPHLVCRTGDGNCRWKWFLDHYDSAGTKVYRRDVANAGGHGSSAVIREIDSVVFDTDVEESPGKIELTFVSDGGQVTHRTSWPFCCIYLLGGNAQGFAAIAYVSDWVGPEYLVRADAKGKIAWHGLSPRSDKWSPLPDWNGGDDIIVFTWASGAGPQSNDSVRLQRYKLTP